jgi:hypothetical protein
MMRRGSGTVGAQPCAELVPVVAESVRNGEDAVVAIHCIARRKRMLFREMEALGLLLPNNGTAVEPKIVNIDDNRCND